MAFFLDFFLLDRRRFLGEFITSFETNPIPFSKRRALFDSLTELAFEMKWLSFKSSFEGLMLVPPFDVEKCDGNFYPCLFKLAIAVLSEADY